MNGIITAKPKSVEVSAHSIPCKVECDENAFKGNINQFFIVREELGSDKGSFTVLKTPRKWSWLVLA